MNWNDNMWYICSETFVHIYVGHEYDWNSVFLFPVINIFGTGSE